MESMGALQLCDITSEIFKTDRAFIDMKSRWGGKGALGSFSWTQWLGSSLTL
jgi:hypothetical protein